MTIQDELLEKYHRYRKHRYKVLIIIKAPLDTLFISSLVEEFAGNTGAQMINFEERYKGRLNEFFIWQDIRNQLYEMANEQATIALDIEPLYAKWPDDERVTFLKSILLSEPKHPLVLLLNCQEDLSGLQEINENSRGLIWAPSKSK
jgi:hypothetical protein